MGPPWGAFCQITLTSCLLNKAVVIFCTRRRNCHASNAVTRKICRSLWMVVCYVCMYCVLAWGPDASTLATEKHSLSTRLLHIRNRDLDGDAVDVIWSEFISFFVSYSSSSFWHATQDCVAPYVDIILHRGRFWAKSAASGSVRWCCFRSCWTVLSHVMRGGPSCLLQSAGGEANRILLAFALSSMRIICPNGVSRHDWIITVSLGCFVSLHTSSFRTNWYHLMPSSIRWHHWSSASILRASVLDIAQQSEPYRNIVVPRR